MALSKSRVYALSRPAVAFKGNEMSDPKTTSADLPYQPIPFAKKHRISVEDAKAILEKHGNDRKSADKEGRRVSV